MNTRPTGKDHDDEGESAQLQLPLLGLYADLELGCGSVHLPDEFNACSSALRIEIIDHWLRDLKVCRERALVQLYQQVSLDHDGRGMPEKLMRFRATCSALGIEVPSEFAVLLQRF